MVDYIKQMESRENAFMSGYYWRNGEYGQHEYYKKGVSFGKFSGSLWGMINNSEKVEGICAGSFLKELKELTNFSKKNFMFLSEKNKERIDKDIKYFERVVERNELQGIVDRIAQHEF